MVLEYLTVSKSFFLLTVKYSKTIETHVIFFGDDNRANGMTTGFYLVVGAQYPAGRAVNSAYSPLSVALTVSSQLVAIAGSSRQLVADSQ